MRFSDTRGKAFGNKRQRSLGTTGEYGKILKWDSMGIARDGVFELEWAVPCKTALNGAFLWPEPEQAETVNPTFGLPATLADHGRQIRHAHKLLVSVLCPHRAALG
jgi:hypothetical protein